MFTPCHRLVTISLLLFVFLGNNFVYEYTINGFFFCPITSNKTELTFFHLVYALTVYVFIIGRKGFGTHVDNYRCSLILRRQIVHLRESCEFRLTFHGAFKCAVLTIERHRCGLLFGERGCSSNKGSRRRANIAIRG